MQTDYQKYRGKCKEMSEAAVKADPSLTLVRGYYYEPIWDKTEQHWWTRRSDGSIYDPTAKQFPSGGIAEFYKEFDGMVKCEICGKIMPEEKAIIQGRFALCSTLCVMELVGLI